MDENPKGVRRIREVTPSYRRGSVEIELMLESGRRDQKN